MNFDKNQTVFPSEKHKLIWYFGVLVMPEEISLSDKVKVLIDENLFESCKQMRHFLLHSLRDMYENVENYQIDPQKYMGFWFNVIDIACHYGELLDDRLVIDFVKWGKTKMEPCYQNVFADTGVQIDMSEDSAEITNTLYPKMFRAMKEMRDAVRAKKEKVSEENSFFYCDFRKLCPKYKYDKTEKRIHMRELEDRIPLLLEGDNKTNALKFAAYLREKNINLKWTGIQNKWSETGQTYGEGKGICYVGLGDTSQKGKKDGWLVSITLEHLNEYDASILNEGLQEFITANIYFCDKTTVNACNGGEKSIYACQRGKDIKILGKEFKYVCRIRNQSSVSVYVHNPDEAAINSIKRLMELENKAR
jgi:hypothetical protein